MIRAPEMQSSTPDTDESLPFKFVQNRRARAVGQKVVRAAFPCLTDFNIFTDFKALILL